MSNGMDALSNKMQVFHLPLVIKKLELEDPLKKILVGELELLPRDPSLVDDSDSNDQLAIVQIVLLW